MAAANFQLVVLGIESAHQSSLNEMKKGISVAQARHAVEILNRNGIMVWGTFIIGNLQESRREIWKTIDYACNLGIDIAQFTVLTPFPGTPLL
jgi:anaerobic magnesium-protoporphyrin IX monomethyl ester cyclase